MFMTASQRNVDRLVIINLVNTYQSTWMLFLKKKSYFVLLESYFEKHGDVKLANSGDILQYGLLLSKCLM